MNGGLATADGGDVAQRDHVRKKHVRAPWGQIRTGSVESGERGQQTGRYRASVGAARGAVGVSATAGWGHSPSRALSLTQWWQLSHW